MATDADFFERNAEFFEDGIWEDDDTVKDVMALIVLHDVPIETINDILRRNEERCGGASYLWLADTYDNLPDYANGISAEGTTAPVDAGWRSPFLGQTVQDAIAFIRNAPKPPKPLCKVFCAVLEKERWEQHGELLICKWIEGEGEPQAIPCVVDEAGGFFSGFERDEWEEAAERWQGEGIQLG